MRQCNSPACSWGRGQEWPLALDVLCFDCPCCYTFKYCKLLIKLSIVYCIYMCLFLPSDFQRNEDKTVCNGFNSSMPPLPKQIWASCTIIRNFYRKKTYLKRHFSPLKLLIAAWNYWFQLAHWNRHWRAKFLFFFLHSHNWNDNCSHAIWGLWSPPCQFWPCDLLFSNTFIKYGYRTHKSIIYSQLPVI